MNKHRGRGRSRGRGRGMRGHFRGGGSFHKPQWGRHEHGDVDENVLVYLRENTSRAWHTAVSIARGSGYHSAKDVNPALYKMKIRGILKMREEKPPLWSLGDNFDDSGFTRPSFEDTEMPRSQFGMGPRTVPVPKQDFTTGFGKQSTNFALGIGNSLGGQTNEGFAMRNLGDPGSLGVGDVSEDGRQLKQFGSGLNQGSLGNAFGEMTVASVMQASAKPSGSYSQDHTQPGQSDPQIKQEMSQSFDQEEASETGESSLRQQDTIGNQEQQDLQGDGTELEHLTGFEDQKEMGSTSLPQCSEEGGTELCGPGVETDLASKDMDEPSFDDSDGMEEEEEYDINDRINDLKACSRNVMFDESSQDAKSNDSPMSVGEDSSKANMSFKERVLVALSGRLLKTASVFVLVKALDCTKEEVDDVLQEMEVEKLVGRTGSAWTMKPEGDAYLIEKGLCGPKKEIVANERRGDQGIYHQSRRGGVRGVPLNPLELMGSNTKFGLKTSGRGDMLEQITQDVNSLINPARQEQMSLTNLTSDSIIGARGQGHGQPFGGGYSGYPGQQVPSGGYQYQNPMQYAAHSVQNSQSSVRSLPMSPLEMIQKERGISQPTGNVGMHASYGGPQSHSSTGAQSMPSMGQSMMGHGSHPSITNMSQGESSLASLSWTLSSLSSGALEITSESFAGVNKNPVSALMEFAQSRGTVAKIEVISSRGPSHKPKFVVAAFVGSRQFPGVESGNKKEGKKEAADVAMRILLAEGHKSGTMGKSGEKAQVAVADMTHFDKVAALCHQAFNQLIASIPETFAGRKIIAGLVLKRNPEDIGIVISIGSGNRCITGQQMSLEGTTVNDCHAEIITRRGFIRFLYRQLETYEVGKPHDLLEQGGSGKLRIKPGITLHLYISTAPCGDGALFSPRDAEANKSAVSLDRQHHPTFTSAVQGLLRTKMEGGEGTIPIESDFVAQTFDGIQRGERLRTMSCTDKICRWNVVGMQGALLSHFIEPVYLDSLTLGFLYDHGHLSRALCCRVDKSEPPINSQLPDGFHLNHPWLGRVTACDASRETQKTKSLSVNWSLGDARPEVLDGPLGLCHTGIEKTFFSRVCKKNLYDSFKMVATKFGRKDLLAADTYNKAKMMAKDFQAARTIMIKKFKESKFGPWVSKPVEEEMFS